MDKKMYVIVGDNDFWYDVTKPVTPEELTQCIYDLKQDIKRGMYPEATERLAAPETFTAYPIGGAHIDFKA